MSQQAQIDDLAMMIRRLARALKVNGKNPILVEQAVFLLKKYGLEGDIFRSAPTDLPGEKG